MSVSGWRSAIYISIRNIKTEGVWITTSIIVVLIVLVIVIVVIVIISVIEKVVIFSLLSSVTMRVIIEMVGIGGCVRLGLN